MPGSARTNLALLEPLPDPVPLHTDLTILPLLLRFQPSEDCSVLLRKEEKLAMIRKQHLHYLSSVSLSELLSESSICPEVFLLPWQADYLELLETITGSLSLFLLHLLSVEIVDTLDIGGINTPGVEAADLQDDLLVFDHHLGPHPLPASSLRLVVTGTLANLLRLGVIGDICHQPGPRPLWTVDATRVTG